MATNDVGEDSGEDGQGSSLIMRTGRARPA